MFGQRIPVLLKGSDRRSIGRSNDVVKLVLRAPKRFDELIQCLWSDDPIVLMRAADAAEKVSALHPEQLEPYKMEPLGPADRGRADRTSLASSADDPAARAHSSGETARGRDVALLSRSWGTSR